MSNSCFVYTILTKSLYSSIYINVYRHNRNVEYSYDGYSYKTLTFLDIAIVYTFAKIRKTIDHCL